VRSLATINVYRGGHSFTSVEPQGNTMTNLGELLVRPEWVATLNDRRQEFLLRSGDADREEFEHALRRLATSVPPYASLVEREWLRAILVHAVTRQAASFHLRHHDNAAARTCEWSPVESLMPVWDAHDTDPRDVLKQWIDAFVTEFDTRHPLPVSLRAAAILRRSFRSPPNLTHLARLVGASRSTLTATFRADYGMSIGQYLTRVRLRSVAVALRTPGSNIKSAAAMGGYASRKSLYTALDQTTSMRPDDFRRLPDRDLEEIFEKKLSLRGVERTMT
jgi:AraC-like DNA-binding protein